MQISYLNSNLFLFYSYLLDEESKHCYVNVDVLFRRKIFGEGEYLFLEEKKNAEGKGGKYLEKISPKFVKDIEKSRSRDFCQFLVSVSVSVLENLVLGKKYHFRFWRIWFQKKVSVSENLVAETKSRFRKIWSWKKVSV